MNMPTYDIEVRQQPDVDFAGIANLEKWLDDVLSRYEGLVIREDQCKEIKGELAELNKIKANIKESAKTAIEILSAPLDLIRNRVDSLTQKIEDTYRRLKDQVDAFAEEERAKKEDDVSQLIKKILAEYPGLGNFDVPVQRKWTNKSTSIKSIEGEIRAIALNELRERKEAEEKERADLERQKLKELANTNNAEQPAETNCMTPTPADVRVEHAANGDTYVIEPYLPADAETKKAPEQEAQEPSIVTESLSHDPEKMSTPDPQLTTMQIIVTWDASVDEEIRVLLRQVRDMASSFAARRIE